MIFYLAQRNIWEEFLITGQENTMMNVYLLERKNGEFMVYLSSL